MSERERTRRAVLALGAGALGLLAGCTGDGDDGAGTATPTETPRSTTETPTDTTPTETPTTDPAVASLAFNHAEKLHRLPEGFSQRDVANFYLAVLTSADHAAAFPTDGFGNQQATAFVDETDFSRSAVVVLQDRTGSSHPDLTLLETGRDGDWLTVEAEYPGEGATADITTDTLLVRIPTGEDGVQGARTTIHPQYGDPVRISTDSVYDTVPEFDSPGDLVVQNRDCGAAPVSLTVTYRGDLFFRDDFELDPATRRRVENLFTHPGEWTVRARAGGETITRTWTLTDTAPGDVLVDVGGDGVPSLAHRPDGVTDDPGDACQTEGLPYESPDPAGNVDSPVSLWVVDQAAASSTLTVTIEDGETRVYSKRFTTREGEDKFRRTGLLAKKTDYTVTVTVADGRSVTQTVTVREGVRELTVRISESGDLSISVD